MKRLRQYPPDIQARVKELVDRDVADHIDHYQKTHPHCTEFDVFSKESTYRWLASWWHEPSVRCSDDEIREYLGLPVKSQDQIIKEILSSHRTGFSIGELTGLDLLDKGDHYELSLPTFP